MTPAAILNHSRPGVCTSFKPCALHVEREAHLHEDRRLVFTDTTAYISLELRSNPQEIVAFAAAKHVMQSGQKQKP